MTAICPGGGPSQPIPATQEIQNLTAAAIVEFLVSQEIGWFAALAAGVGYLTYSLSGLCTTDPPALPNITADRIAGYFNPTNPLGAAQLREDTTALVAHYLWYQYCECVTGPQPAPPPPMPQPPGYQTDNPSINPTSQNGTCLHYENNLFGATFAGNPPTFSYALSNNFNFPPGATGSTVTLTWPSVNPVIFPATLQLACVSSGAGVAETIANFTINTPAANTPAAYSLALPIQPSQYQLTMTSLTGLNEQVDLDYTVEMVCGGGLAAPGQDCCPPDPQLMNIISQVLRLEYEILAGLSGQKSPFVDSTVHSNLTGTGAVSISPTAAAIRIDITSKPTPWPDNPGTPDFLFSIGFITPFAVGTPLRGSRLVYDHQTFQYPSYTDQIGYTLAGGVLINLVELVTAPAGQ